jgi:hypothetical protein
MREIARGASGAELYDVGVVPGAVWPMSLSFASDEILGLITHDPLVAEVV